MKLNNSYIINAFTDLDEMMQMGNGPIKLLSPQQLFEMGQFYQWATKIVDDEGIDFEAETEVPEEFAWVVGETQGW